ncbi:hypothetical protein LOTGIDRAFT_161263 [Lottia gigantea]|uniref:Uncharacterized protein n=1 Tax=Lottia gigantea TaxID=225164 RepID=V4ALU1_LOTGI|nr:hypothetical protein LOTGIDRAFT_161263 [Lottia gigantea]ESO94561.1 hypothetical protein LOTGIDRAFT_161263 [Lottia gigantea]
MDTRYSTSFIYFLVCFTVVVFADKNNDDSCTPTNCKLPDCRCPGHNIPGGYKPEEIPQMVLITFDDAVNWENWGYYSRLFPPDGSRKNPNGCPIGMTLFVSHNYTDYCMIKKLHSRGMEIADHSISHRMPQKWWAEISEQELRDEILKQKTNLADLADVPIADIKGWRSPFLQPTGDTMFSILYNNNFTYDATMTYPYPRNVYSPVMWPFTLDYSYTLLCNIKPCPKNAYPGFWILPVVILMDYREEQMCAYVDYCANAPRNKQESFDMLWKNFLRNYRTNRAPLYINLHSRWLNTDYNIDAMDDFIQRLLSMEDVYITTVSKAINWMKNPKTLSEIKNFDPWKCNFKPNQEDDAFCSFTYKPRITARPTSTIPPENDVHEKQETTNHGKHDHRPWFLKNSASMFKPVVTSIVFVIYVFKMLA